MKWKISIVVTSIAAMLALNSCSGLKTPCTNCGPTGNAKVSITLFDAPSTGVSILSLTMPIVGVSLTPSSGALVPVYSPASPGQFELTRLQTDSSLIINGVSVASGTYTSVNVTVGASTGIFINASANTLGSCKANSVCDMTPGAAYTFNIPISLTLNANQNQWIGLDINLANAITTANGGGVTVDFSQANVMTATTTVATGNPTNVADTIEDFVGTVTAVSNSSITVQSGTTTAALTAIVNSNTTYDDPQHLCNGGASINCLLNNRNSVVSIDVFLNTDGTLTANEIDIIDASGTLDEVEGIVYPLCQGCTQYGMILSDKTVFSGNAPLTAAALGTGVFLTLDANPTFSVDTKTLTNSFPNPVGFASGSDVLVGQVVRARLSSATAHNGGGVDAVADSFILRFSRLTGLVNTVTTPLFTVSSLPSYLYAFGGSLSATPQVQTFSPGTVYQGITQLSDLQPNNSMSIRTLYLKTPSPYPFVTTKVRKH